MHISPAALSLVVGEEDLVRGRGQLIVPRNGILEIPRKAEQLGKNFPFRRIRESPELLNEMLRFGGHNRIYLSRDRDIPDPSKEMLLVPLTAQRSPAMNRTGKSSASELTRRGSKSGAPLS